MIEEASIKNQENLPYRQGVHAIVLDNENNILLVQKQSYGDNQWDFPGGGVDEGEEPKNAVLRELEEELGSKAFEIIKESPFKDKFEWPEEAQQRGFDKHGKWWRGQEKLQFITRFTGSRDEINIQNEEIRKIAWVPYSQLENYLVFEGQWENAKKVLGDLELF